MSKQKKKKEKEISAVWRNSSHSTCGVADNNNPREQKHTDKR